LGVYSSKCQLSSTLVMAINSIAIAGTSCLLLACFAAALVHPGTFRGRHQLHPRLLRRVLRAAPVTAAAVREVTFLVVCQRQAPASAVWMQAVAWPVEAPMHEHTLLPLLLLLLMLVTVGHSTHFRVLCSCATSRGALSTCCR
jgi:hypothetical protein